MLRKLILLGVFVGVTASVPVFLEKSDKNAPPREESLRVAVARETASATGRRTQIAADAQGHFSGLFTVNGRSLSGVIDTGATTVAINETTARRLGIRLAPVDFTREARTANGVVRAAPVIIDRIEIGRISVERVHAIVLDDSALSDTLIGMSFLTQLKRYSVSQGALVLEQ